VEVGVNVAVAESVAVGVAVASTMIPPPQADNPTSKNRKTKEAFFILGLAFQLRCLMKTLLRLCCLFS
jgi:hypothetical protein